MATYSKLLLSGSINGQQILINSGSSALTNIHTTPSGTSFLDEIYLYAYNDSTASAKINVLWGGTAEPNNVFRTTLLSKYGRTLLSDGMLLTSGSTVSCYADVSGSVLIDGFVNRISS